MPITSEFQISSKIFNPVYRPLLESNVPLQIIFGGASAGKSFFIIGQRMIIDLLKGGRNYLCVRNVARTIRDSVFNEAQKGIERMKASHLFNVNKSEMTITCKNGYQAIMSGLDNVEKVKSITPRKGVLTDVIIEEATETIEKDIKELRRRMRGVVPGNLKKRITMLFNPIFKTHWIYKTYFAGKWPDGKRYYKDDDVLILKTTYKDNLDFLAEEDIKLLENETNQYDYKVYTLGDWGVLGFLVFTNWQIDDLTRMKNKFDVYNNGLDFGFSNDPTALSRSCPTKRGELYILDEIYEKGLTNPDIAARIKPIINNEYIRCDSSAPKDIVELSQYGIKALGAAKGPGSVLHGIQWLQQYKIIIHKECQNHINEFQLYQWDTDKDGDPINTPVDKHNHCIDALRYGNSHQYLASDEEVYSAKTLGVF